MAISIDGSPSTQTGSAATSLSWSHTVGTSKSGRLLSVSFHAVTSSLSSLAATYGGKSMTLLTSKVDAVNSLYAAIFYLVSPPTGSNTVSITWVTSTTAAGSALSMFDVSRFSPFLPGSGTSEGPVTSAPSLAVPSTNGGVAVDCLTTNNSATYTVGASQVITINNAGFQAHASYELTTTTSATMSWTKGSASTHIGIGASYMPGSSGSGISISPFIRV